MTPWAFHGGLSTEYKEKDKALDGKPASGIVWHGPCSTHRQAQELISGPDLATRPKYCPLIGHNPGLLLASLLYITPWEDIYI